MKCDLCSRVGDRGFRGLLDVTIDIDGNEIHCPAMVVCKAEPACRKRQRQVTKTSR